MRGCMNRDTKTRLSFYDYQALKRACACVGNVLRYNPNIDPESRADLEFVLMKLSKFN